MASKIEELRKAYEAATGGEWLEDYEYDDTIRVHFVRNRSYDHICQAASNNAEFIALAHEMMPLLLEAVEIVRSNYIGNARAEALLEKLK